jgi:hypothetical protein
VHSSHTNSVVCSQRAHVGECLLRCIRGWPLAVLERHVDELQKAVVSLISDADGAARSIGRIFFWSFAGVFPGRTEALLASLSVKVQVRAYAAVCRLSVSNYHVAVFVCVAAATGQRQRCAR